MKNVFLPILLVLIVLSSCNNNDILEEVNQEEVSNDIQMKTASFRTLSSYSYLQGWRVSYEVKTRVPDGGSLCQPDIRDPNQLICTPTYKEIITKKTHLRRMADVNGDGKADIIGFYSDKVYVSLSHGNGFGTPTVWTSQFTTSWNTNHVRTVADVNGDGKADIIGFEDSKVYVALSNGSNFSPATEWTSAFTNGWSNSKHIRYVADVNGDGKSDIIGFGDSKVYVALSYGNGFRPATEWTSAFTSGWSNTNNKHIRTVADVNGDGRADIVGFGDSRIYVALSNGSSFRPATEWTSAFTGLWNTTNHVRKVKDVNGDGRADIIGFGDSKIYVALSNGSSFQSAKVWSSRFTSGWSNSKNVRTIGDVSGDGKGDIIGFGNDKVVVDLSNGSSFYN